MKHVAEDVCGLGLCACGGVLIAHFISPWAWLTPLLYALWCAWEDAS